MVRSLHLLVVAFALLLSGTAGADSHISTLIEHLRNGADFRVRVQAALELGKTHDHAALKPLEDALDDPNAAVRAASAAALKVLGDKKAIPVLKRHRLDKSAAVRSQIKASIAGLQRKVVHEKTKVLVKLGKIRDGAHVRSRKWIGELQEASRARLDQLPGVKVMGDDEDYKAAAKKRKPPVVMVTGRLRRFQAQREGADVVYSARVEYVVHRMPEQAIAGTVSGSASAKASRVEVQSRARVEELRHAVLVAAVDSAIRRAPKALMHAAE